MTDPIFNLMMPIKHILCSGNSSVFLRLQRRIFGIVF